MGADGTRRGWRDDARVAEILDEGDLLYVAVTTRRGPHVTPTAFDRDGRRLWFVTPRRSVKARTIRRHREVGALVRMGERAVIMSGRARIVDPLTARGVFSVNRLLDLPLAATGFLGRNHRHVTGTVRDHKAPTLALARVAVSVDITRLALLEGERVAATWGVWEHGEPLPSGSPLDVGPPDLSGVPSALRSFLAADDQPVVLGWQTPTGPLALPARWRGATGMAETSGAAMALAGAGPAGPACVTVDRSRYRLKHKRGLLLGGTGHARVEDGTASVAIEQDRLTWWDGEDTGTTLRRRDGAASHGGA
ncbi:MAG: pyridoxamine 5'-phosphate oxidase family protein, partial [Acidimicrobiia bacterium]